MGEPETAGREVQRRGLGLIWFFQRGRPVSQAQPAERRESWTVAAIIAESWPGEASRPSVVFHPGVRPLGL